MSTERSEGWDDTEHLVRDDGSEVTAEHLHEIQVIARIEAERIVQDWWENPERDELD